MNRRRFFFTSAACALGGAWNLQARPVVVSDAPASGDPLTALKGTHAALFDLWFPLDQLPIPPSMTTEISNIAAAVSAGMFEAFTASSSGLLPLLAGLTDPVLLPFYPALQNSQNPAVQSFISTSGGFGAMPKKWRKALFSFLFEGTSGPQSMQLAMLLREAYLSGIWDLPLAVPLTGIQPPQVFVSDIPAYVKEHAPEIPPSRLRYDPASKTITHADGQIDYLVVGSGPGGATVAHELQRSGKRVVLIERGPFVVWGSMQTRNYPALMYEQSQATTVDNSCIIRSGQALGGGSTVNIDLAFSPMEASIQAHIKSWIDAGLINGSDYTPQRISSAYQWVKQVIGTRAVQQDEINADNYALWDGATAYGIEPSLYHLNRFRTGHSPSPVDDKKDAARQLLLNAAQDTHNPLSVIPDAVVDEIIFEEGVDGSGLRAIGLQLTVQQPWTQYGNTVINPCGLNISPGTSVIIGAGNIILAAGAIGTTRILANTAKSNPPVANSRIGKGLVCHPSMPIIGLFDKEINMLEGLDSSVFVDTFAVQPGFIFEAMTGLPAYGAILIPGDGKQVYENVSQYNHYAGYGVALIDTPSEGNSISVNEQGAVEIRYALSEGDKNRFRQGVAAAIRMMFLAGAKQVVVPSNENLLGIANFDPMHGVYLTHIGQADLVEQNLQFIPNRTVLTAAHLQATNKIGPSPDTSVVSTNQRLWTVNGSEVPNVYVMDCSIFPTSVGANPMQSIYTFAKIFSDRLLGSE